MSKNRKKNSLGRIVWPIFLSLAYFALIIAVLLHGNNVAVFNPKGLIAHEQHNLILLVVGIMLIIAIPAVFLFFFTAWKYRESNTRAKHDPDHRHSTLLVSAIWLVPTTFAVVLSIIMWSATHRLAPQQAIASDVKPLTIQVVAMRWKWLFIYPDQHIATVNFVQLPMHTPVKFELTADDTPMSSFWIPNLAGMLYTMTGHENHLNLMADTPGDYTGSSAEINGGGFADMKFTVRVGTKDNFDFWVKTTQLSGNILDATEYDKLLKPSQNNPATLYSSADSDLYDKVLMKYMGPDGGSMQGMYH